MIRLYNIEVIFSKNGVRAYGVDGDELPWFNILMNSIREIPYNSRRAIASGAARFGDFIIEASRVANEDGIVVSAIVMEEIVRAYRDYLCDGGDATEYFAKRVFDRIPHKSFKANTINSLLSAATKVCACSNLVHRQQSDFVAAGLINSGVSSIPQIHSRVNKPATPMQRKALLEHSLIAGVVAGGAKTIRQSTFSYLPVPYDLGERLDFPHEYSMPLLEKEPNPGYRAYFALSFAAGGRPHEFKQMLFEDLKPGRGEIELVAPALRRSHPAYLGLTGYERDRLCWKGRQTRSTVLLPPYDEVFWDAYTLYNRMFPRRNSTDFAFTVTKGKTAGRPLFLSDPKTLNNAFRRAVSRIGLELTPRTDCLYTMRHHYGVFLLNYFPRSNGDFGFPIGMVMNAMGHVDERSTKKYARYDTDVMKMEVALAMDARICIHPAQSVARQQLIAFKKKAEEFERRVLGLEND